MQSLLPDVIGTEAELDEYLTRPTTALKASIETLQGPLVVLGAGGKMGPTLCVLARRAAEEAGHSLDVVAVSRFSDEQGRRWLEDRGVRTVKADLMERESLAILPDAQDVIYLVGLKFGTQQNPARTWAVNTLAPLHASERYGGARIVALSTGNVYPFVRVADGGSVESDPLIPLGEYANACVARERLFAYGAQRYGTRVALIRLNYAVDLRYGVLVDIARKVAVGEPVDVTMGYFNCIWQGDANERILRALPFAENPPVALNLTGTDVLSVRALAQRLGELMDRPVRFTGQEAETGLLSKTDRVRALFGDPPTPVEALLRWTAHWIREGGATLDKPTHFQVRDGRY